MIKTEAAKNLVMLFRKKRERITIAIVYANKIICKDFHCIKNQMIEKGEGPSLFDMEQLKQIAYQNY